MGSYRKKAGRLLVFPRLSSPPARACRTVQQDRRPYPAPAPCRTQGDRGAADTPPAPVEPAHFARAPIPTGWHYQGGGQSLPRPYQYKNAIPASKTRNPIWAYSCGCSEEFKINIKFFSYFTNTKKALQREKVEKNAMRRYVTSLTDCEANTNRPTGSTPPC